MTETQKRIKAYQKALPHMRERVIAVAMLLVVSLSMVTSASFAWLTLSTAPEVSSVTTTVAANGNLEIALSGAEGVQPEDSRVGDSYATTDDVSISNLTWGNLINLAHESYGLNSIVLRPASLNTRDLINSPVYAVQYGADGRVTNYINDFAFTIFNRDLEVFRVPEQMQYGVRAISSVTYTPREEMKELAKRLDALNEAFSKAKGQFQAIYGSEAYMKTVGSLVGVHVSYTLGDDPDVLVSSDDMTSLMAMMRDFKTCMTSIGEIIVDMMNIYNFLQDNHTEYKFEDVFEVNYDGSTTYTNNHMDNALLDRFKDRIPAINTYRTAWKNTVNATRGILTAGEKSTVYWKADLMSHVSLMCNMDTAELDGDTPAELQADMINKAVSIITSNAEDHVAVINDGAIKDADQLIDGEMHVKKGIVSITVVVPQSIKDKVKDKLGFLASMVPDVLTLKPEIKTGAKPPALLDTDYKSLEATAAQGGNWRGEAEAADTFAMAVDFWIRTNVQNSLLVLEGEVETVEEEMLDADGNPVLDDNGNKVTQTKVVGYGGVNRVWSEMDEKGVSGLYGIPEHGISTTQGSGSCYVFYADNPETESQSLNMLRAMRVAFVNAEGKLLAQAFMDVDHVVRDAGRIIVPLQLRDQLEPVMSKDGTKKVYQYVMPLQANQAERITAIIYLDGAVLNNDDVLEAGTIRGQLNIQFGTADREMLPVDDDTLKRDYYTIQVVTPSNGEMNYDEGYDSETKNATLIRFAIDGTNPRSVKGNFLSIINENQGSSEPEFTMTRNADGYWEAVVPFSGPGKYELRSLKIDGVDVPLDESNVIRVNISGVGIEYLTCGGDWGSGMTFSDMTSDTYYNQDMTLKLNSADIHSVRGIFIGNNGKNVSVEFKYDKNQIYRGTANFTASGTYEMSYLEIDGNPVPLEKEKGLYKQINLTLGLYTQIQILQPQLPEGIEPEKAAEILKNVSGNQSGWSFVYTAEEPLTMKVRCKILDDTGNSIQNLENVVLRYAIAGSNTNMLDADMEWVVTSGQYEGEFLFQYSGVYQFRTVMIGEHQQVDIASISPKITSIPPAEMEYIEQPEYAPLTFDLGMDADDRVLKISMKNASAASLDVVVQNGKGETQTISVPSGVENKDTGVTTFKVKVPDGQWTIVDAYASTVFYNKTFYGGLDTVTGEDNRLQLSTLPEAAEIAAGEISTYFLTEVQIGVSGAPNASTYSGAFMTDHPVENMQITVLNSGQPLETVLKSLASMGIEDTSVVVSMKYVLDEANINYTYSGSADAMPNRSFGGVLALNASGVYPMGSMNFLMEGTYEPEFSLTVAGVTYSEANGNLDKLSGVPNALKSTNKVTVTWTRPTVEITNISPKGGHTAVNTSKNQVNVTSAINSKYSCTVYAEATAKTTCGQKTGEIITEPVAELTASGFGNAESAYMPFTSTSGTVYLYDGDTQVDRYTWTTAGGTVSRKVGYYAGSCSDAKPAGVLTGSKVVLVYGGVEYSLPLDASNVITINNPH